MTSEHIAIRVDPLSGRKTFDTRAAKASDRITGSGYGITTDAAKKVVALAAGGHSSRTKKAGRS